MRAAELEAIRATYRRYDATNRARIWDVRTPGYRRLVDDLDARLLELLRPAVPARGGVLLDLGCGDGALAASRLALESDLRWIGLDIRPDAIESAREQFHHAEFVVASADDVPLDAGSVDVVVARVLFSSLPSAPLEMRVANEIGRVLKPGGSLAWLDIRYGNPFNRSVHGMSAARISRLFPGWHAELQAAGLLPPIARRLGPRAVSIYPLLSSIGPFRSHLVGRLIRPIA